MSPGEWILPYIPIGRKKAITRRELVAVTGVRDREVRKAIHCARRIMPIINLSNGGGYYIPDMNNPEEVKALVKFVQQEEGRLKSIGWALKTARQTLKNCSADIKPHKESE